MGQSHQVAKIEAQSEAGRRADVAVPREQMLFLLTTQHVAFNSINLKSRRLSGMLTRRRRLADKSQR